MCVCVRVCVLHGRDVQVSYCFGEHQVDENTESPIVQEFQRSSFLSAPSCLLQLCPVSSLWPQGAASRLRDALSIRPPPKGAGPGPAVLVENSQARGGEWLP